MEEEAAAAAAEKEKEKEAAERSTSSPQAEHSKGGDIKVYGERFLRALGLGVGQG